MAVIELKNNTKLTVLIPQSTGVYLFLDTNKKPVYIGKAVNLRYRIKQHLDDERNPKERALVENSDFLEWVETRSEFEALLLEARLVNKEQPKYNAQLRDDKSPLYIVVTKEAYPKVRLMRKRDLVKGLRYVFGPIAGVSHARLLLRRVRRIIPYCTERKIGKKPCFYSHLRLCDPCPNSISLLADEALKIEYIKKYKRNIARFIKLLKGDGARLITEFEREMAAQAHAEHFEEAAATRDKLTRLQALFQARFISDEALEDTEYLGELIKEETKLLEEVVGVAPISRVECFDVSTFQFKDSTASMVVFEQGIPVKGKYRRFKIRTKTKFDPEMLYEVLERRLKHTEWGESDLIIIDGGVPQLRAVYPRLKERYVNLPVFIGIAKHPDRILLASTMEYLSLSADSPALHYIQRVRDEAHRFAKKYHTLLRKKELLGK